MYISHTEKLIEKNKLKNVPIHKTQKFITITFNKQKPTAKLSINSFYCVTQYVHSVSTKSWVKKIRNSLFEFTVLFHVLVLGV